MVLLQRKRFVFGIKSQGGRGTRKDPEKFVFYTNSTKRKRSALDKFEV